MSEELAKHIKGRGVFKASLTRFATFLNGVQATPCSDPTFEQCRSQLALRLESAVNLLNDFNDIQLKIEYSREDDQDVLERESFENNYYQAISAAKQILANNSGHQQEQSAENFATQSEISRSVRSTIQLPKINLPTFSGLYENWYEFKDMFTSLVHNNINLSGVEKFYYLKASLKDKAAEVLLNIDISTENYTIAWNLLCERYDNKWLIIHNHVSALFDLPPLSKESHAGLRDLYHNMSKHLRSLKALGQPTDSWDTLLIIQIARKFDHVSAREWESYQIEGEIPTMTDMNKFLKSRCELLEKINLHSNTKATYGKPRSSSNFLSANNISCSFCKNSHSIFKCEEFLKLSINDRISRAKSLKLCINCLRYNHFSKDCTSGNCKTCGKKHSTLLHIPQGNNVAGPVAEASTSSGGLPQAINLSQVNYSYVLLPTATIFARDSSGKLHKCRALLDSGAQSNFITEELCDMLQLNKHKINMSIVGINQYATSINFSSDVTIKSRINSFSNTITCLVTNKICDNIPTMHGPDLIIPKNIKLADDSNENQAKIDILIGSANFWSLLCMGQYKLGNNRPILQKTVFGWVIAGPTQNISNNFCTQSFTGTCLNKNLDEQVAKFWEIESIQNNSILSTEEIKCEEQFANTVRRDNDGRFIVSIPFSDSTQKLGNSLHLATRRLYALERKFQANAALRQTYCAFMREYIELGHMSEVKNDTDTNNYYLPHHCVLKEDSTSTKLRVVFDGSAKSSSGVSLNDLQMVGPQIQDDLLSITMRFRKYNYVLSADICKMYRQVLIDESERCFQRIVWRENPDDALKIYNLNTVTYGTASASFLAIRSLHEIAKINANKYPEASKTIMRDFYVDDLLTGGDSREEVLKLHQEISEILNSAGFELRKWVCNDSNIFQCGGNPLADVLEIGSSEYAKTLGLYWCPNEDTLRYNVKISDPSLSVTKRTILSQVASIFDPLGLLAPCIIVGKVILQELWQFDISWDESIPLNLHTKWINFRDRLSMLNSLKIPRQIVCRQPVKIEMHGFSDASESAYGACIYLRSLDTYGNIFVQLLCAKTRVAPLKRISIPRLELCAAVTLSQLSKRIVDSMGISFHRKVHWSDSTIALCWLKMKPHCLNTFVANRVTEIQNNTNTADWFHVSTNENPADILTRGIHPSDLPQNHLWWQGPTWLRQVEATWPTNEAIEIDHIPEIRTLTFLSNSRDLYFSERIDHVLENTSSLSYVQNIVAYCFRFGRNTRLKVKESKSIGPLKPEELQASMACLIRIAQEKMFPSELHDLKRSKRVSASSKLYSLNPFLDSSDLIRVGGRLQASQADFSKMHPILLPKGHKLTTLLISQEHARLLHAGPQQVLFSLRETYWPIDGRNQVRSVTQRCVKCFRAKPMHPHYLMGSLPASRVVPALPFTNCGVDYAGPFPLKNAIGRGSKIIKAYVCLFICLAVKAVHLEIVTDLTTDSFISTFRRFVARRGKPNNIYSDNGTTFIGANGELNKLKEFLLNERTKNEISTTAAQEGVTWHFIPARSPHFGGIWEAGIKSMKGHLKRVIGDIPCNFPQFYTVITQIEAILNSRPLTPLSSDPHDLNPLTPGHFLIGRPMTALPDPCLRHLRENRLSMHQRVQQITQHIWKRWSKEYITELQQRTKWRRTNQQQLKVGSMVLLAEDNVSTLKWPLGRIIALHPGADGIVRVVTVKTVVSVLKRSVNKICVLPIIDNVSN